MKLEVIWSEFAESQLDEIFEFYKTEASINTAKKSLTNLIN